jgi:uncharacterized protein YjbJ (UPF0337 family)
VIQTAQTRINLANRFKLRRNQFTQEEFMDSNRVKGAVDEIMGIAKQKTGDLTGNTKLQVEGIAQNLKGKVESSWGKAVDAVHEANEEAGAPHDPRA